MEMNTLRETWLASYSSLPPRGGDCGGQAVKTFFCSLLETEPLYGMSV